ncbi:MAG TPA: lysozyme [Bacteroidales bacterium]|nr:lysozyme [Bacteroidales bacterium]
MAKTTTTQRVPIQYLVIHCTDTPEGRHITSDDIRRWHLKERGWKQVGYTDMIHLDGTVERLVENNDDAYVDGWEVTNGVRGYNRHSRHVVYVGGKARNGIAYKDTRTPEQIKALTKICKEFAEIAPNAKIVGHRDLNKAKDCPCFDVKAFVKEIGIKQ